MQELQVILSSEMESYPYNTVGSFLAFYEAFRQQSLPLRDFYESYTPDIIPESYSCVGQARSILDRVKSTLGNCYPGLKSALFIASCEEMITHLDEYTSCSPPAYHRSVKEHCLVVLKILVEGRHGFVVLDPGYHVNIPVIVMADGMFPNTGWFLLSDTSRVKKEYEYAADGDYIRWHIKETKGGTVTSSVNLIYVARKFLSYVDVSEKRNLVFNYRTVVARDKMQPIAGFYCNLEGDEKFTFFYSDGADERVEVKVPFEYFRGDRDDNQFESVISSCIAQIGLNRALLSDMVKGILEAYFDSDFMPFVSELNHEIDEE